LHGIVAKRGEGGWFSEATKCRVGPAKRPDMDVWAGPLAKQECAATRGEAGDVTVSGDQEIGRLVSEAAEVTVR